MSAHAHTPTNAHVRGRGHVDVAWVLEKR